MIKEVYKEIVKNGIQPAFAEAGFKKSGNHFYKRLDEVQQVVTLQLSHGNSHEQLRFYFRCGILVNGLKKGPRELKTESEADYRFSINDVSSEFENDYFDLELKSNVAAISNDLDRAIEKDLIPFFSKLENEKSCIDYMISQESLQGSVDLIKYLCLEGNTHRLEEYVLRLTKFLKAMKDQYSDPNMSRRRLDKIISLIEELGHLTPDLSNKIEMKWSDAM